MQYFYFCFLRSEVQNNAGKKNPRCYILYINLTERCFTLPYTVVLSWSIFSQCFGSLKLWKFLQLPSLLGLWCWRCQVLQKKKKNTGIYFWEPSSLAPQLHPQLSLCLSSVLYFWNVFLPYFMNSHTDSLLKVSSGLQWTFKSLLTVTDLIPLEGAGYAAVVWQCWEVQRSST